MKVELGVIIRFTEKSDIETLSMYDKYIREAEFLVPMATESYIRFLIAMK